MPHQPASAALARFRVIDLTQVRAGPTCCRQLADWGADVIQVQMPEHMPECVTDERYKHKAARSVNRDSPTAEILKASPEADLDRCRQLIRDCLASDDHAEGRRVFMEKRRPVFHGR